MNEKLIGLVGIICLLAVIAGCGQRTPPQVSSPGKESVQGPVAASPAAAEVGGLEAGAERDDTASVVEVGVEPSITKEIVTAEVDGHVEKAAATKSAPLPLEIPRFENELAEGSYRWSQLLPRDGIHPIYEPQFAPAQEAPYAADELVIGVEIDGEAKAYAIGPLNSREMVNDELGGIPILVTW